MTTTESGSIESSSNDRHQSYSLEGNKLYDQDGHILRDDSTLVLRPIGQLALNLKPKVYDSSEKFLKYTQFSTELREAMIARQNGDSTKNPLPPTSQELISSFYGTAVEMLGENVKDISYLRQHLPIKDSEFEEQKQYENRLTGIASELTFSALLLRDCDGSDADPVTLLPSTPEEDQIGYDMYGIYHGYDFTVISRETNEATKVQIKTGLAKREEDGAASHAKTYSPEILVVTLDELAGDRMSLRALQFALISEVEGVSQPSQEQKIESAAQNLKKLLKNHAEFLHTYAA